MPDSRRAQPTTDPPGPVVAGPGWHPDPFDPGRRLRWWDGDVWSARVVTLEAGSEAISWHHRMSEHGAPAAVVAPPVAPASADVMTTLAALAPTRAETAIEAEPAADRQPRAHRRLWALAAAAVLILGGAAAASAAMLGGGERPTVAPTIVYRDAAAGFSFKFPDGWSVEKRTAGEGVRFKVGAKDATPLETNTVSIVAGTTTGQPLPALHLLINSTTAQLIAERPNISLVSADPARLAHAQAYRLELIDSGTSPPTRIVQVIGRTTSGRPLIVNLLVREPRTAPGEREFQRFLASIAPN